MYNFVRGCFKTLKNLFHFVKILSILLVIIVLLYWIQNTVHAHWAWLAFLTPFLDNLTNFANDICPATFELFGTPIEVKYISAMTLLILIYFTMDLFVFLLSLLEGGYIGTHFLCKKTGEIISNKRLHADIAKVEKAIKNYVVTISTQIKPKYSLHGIEVNLDEQNKIMLDFIESKLGLKHTDFEGGYRYDFDNFDKIDDVLDIMFKLINSSAPIDYAICVQELCDDESIKKLKKMMRMKHFGKIVTASDTSYRYKYNDFHRYKTGQVGIFQYGEKMMEVHEFLELSK